MLFLPETNSDLLKCHSVFREGEGGVGMHLEYHCYFITQQGVCYTEVTPALTFLRSQDNGYEVILPL